MIIPIKQILTEAIYRHQEFVQDLTPEQNIKNTRLLYNKLKQISIVNG